jgi:MFS family permease
VTLNTLLIASIALVTFLMPLDITVLAMSLRSIQRDLGAGFSDLQWIANVYNIVYASMLPVAGVLVARFGCSAVFVTACLIFGATSIMAGMADTAGLLIIMRLMQGGAGALILIAGMITMRTTMPPARLGIAFGIWGSAIGAGVAFGPLIGNLIVNNLGWRWIFFLNLPLALLAILPFFHLRAQINAETLSLRDFVLPCSAGALLALLCLYADRGEITITPVLPVLIIGVTLLLAWALRQKRLADTLGLFLFRNSDFRTGTGLGILLDLSFWAMIPACQPSAMR